MVGTRNGIIAYNTTFRLDLENTCYKASICEELQQENSQLKEKIEKAIEYIKDKTNIIPLEQGGGLELCDYDIANLLEILKGDKE